MGQPGRDGGEERQIYVCARRDEARGETRREERQGARRDRAGGGTHGTGAWAGAEVRACVRASVCVCVEREGERERE